MLDYEGDDDWSREVHRPSQDSRSSRDTATVSTAADEKIANDGSAEVANNGQARRLFAPEEREVHHTPTSAFSLTRIASDPVLSGGGALKHELEATKNTSHKEERPDALPSGSVPLSRLQKIGVQPNFFRLILFVVVSVIACQSGLYSYGKLSSTTYVKEGSIRIQIKDFLTSTDDFIVIGRQNFNITSLSRVFVLTPHKSGTSSLGRAFEMMGFRHYDFTDDYYRGLILKCRANSHPSSAEFVKYMQECASHPKTFPDKTLSNLESSDAPIVFEDSPWNHGNCYKHIQSHYRNSLFVLSMRETESWIKSFKTWTTSTMKGTFRSSFYQCLVRTNYGSYETDHENNIISLNESQWISNRLQRDQEIVDFFSGFSPSSGVLPPRRGDACNEYDGPSSTTSSTLLLTKKLGWEPFAFLNFPVPRNKSFPIVNRQS